MPILPRHINPSKSNDDFPDGSFLALGSHIGNIYIYTSLDKGFSYRRYNTLKVGTHFEKYVEPSNHARNIKLFVVPGEASGQRDGLVIRWTVSTIRRHRQLPHLLSAFYFLTTS